MAKSIAVKPKKRGRPPSGGRDPFFGIRIPTALMQAVDRWAKTNGAATRSEAFRKLIEFGLSGHESDRPTSELMAEKAAGLAAQAIEKATDKSQPAEEQKTRKRKLISGPSEFREIRRDQPKRKT
jgi:hypothetical protein